MATLEGSGHSAPRNPDIHYPTADEREAKDFLGLKPTAARVRADFNLEAVSIAFDGAEVLLSPAAAIGMIVRMIEAVDDLRARAS